MLNVGDGKAVPPYAPRLPRSPERAPNHVHLLVPCPPVHRTDAAERLLTSKRSFKRRIMPVSPGIAKCIPNNDKMENTKRDWS